MIRTDVQPGRRPRPHETDEARTGRRTRALALGGSATAWLLALAFVTVGTVRALPRVTSAGAREIARATGDRTGAVGPEAPRAARAAVAPAGAAPSGSAVAPAPDVRPPRTTR